LVVFFSYYKHFKQTTPNRRKKTYNNEEHYEVEKERLGNNKKMKEQGEYYDNYPENNNNNADVDGYARSIRTSDDESRNSVRSPEKNLFNVTNNNGIPTKYTSINENDFRNLSRDGNINPNYNKNNFYHNVNNSNNRTDNNRLPPIKNNFEVIKEIEAGKNERDNWENKY
jgi:hypothetical protein